MNKDYRDLKVRLSDIMFIDLEGFLNPDSTEEMMMVEQLFGELLAEEHVVLSRLERQRLYDEVVEDILRRVHR